MVLPKHIGKVLGGTWQLLNNTRAINGTDAGPGFLGFNPVGLLTYNPNGYMSANLMTTNPAYIPPVRNPDKPTQEDYALIGKHMLVYAGELHVIWENSTATSGRLQHGPLLVSSATSWLHTNQTRDYTVTLKAKETGGKDVLHLFARNQTTETFSSLYWVRVP